jgi:hypothetical protein
LIGGLLILEATHLLRFACWRAFGLTVFTAFRHWMVFFHWEPLTVTGLLFPVTGGWLLSLAWCFHSKVAAHCYWLAVACEKWLHIVTGLLFTAIGGCLVSLASGFLSLEAAYYHWLVLFRNRWLTYC